MIDIETLKAEIGKKLKAAREEKGMSQEHVATMLGLSKVGYGALERGKNLIGLQYLIMLTFILEKPITYFLPNHILTEDELNDITHDPLFSTFVETWQLLSELADLGDEAGRKAKAALRLQAEVYGNLARERLKRKMEE